jgi:hypothetical protein
MTPGFVIEPEATRNIITLRYRGHVTAAEFSAAQPKVELLIAEMKVGFTILADMSELELMDLECGPYISHVMDLCRQQGVGKVVRVMPDPSKDIGINILSIIHYRGKVPIATYETLAEALVEIGS